MAEVKLKGFFAKPGLQKNPANEIATEAVVEFLTKQTPIDKTVRGCQDIRRFVTVRTVSGGSWDQEGVYLGKAVRWYYSTSVVGPLTDKKGGKVPRSDGAKALMQLPEEFPSDVDHGWYIAEAKSILRDLGYFGAPTKLTKRQIQGKLHLLIGAM